MPDQMTKIYKTKLSSGKVSPLFPHSVFMKRLIDLAISLTEVYSSCHSSFLIAFSVLAEFKSNSTINNFK